MEPTESEERAILRAAIRVTLDCVEHLHARPKLEWPDTVRRLIADLRELRIGDTEVLWALLSVVIEQIDRRGTPSERDLVPPPVPLMPNAERLIQEFECQILALIPADTRSARHLRIERIIEYVEQHYDEHLTLDVLASVIGRHRVSLADEFKEKTGLTVHAYITRVRVRRAAELLRSDELGAKIEAVMMAVGYHSKKNFYRQFKDHFGVTPGEYRERFVAAHAADLHAGIPVAKESVREQIYVDPPTDTRDDER